MTTINDIQKNDHVLIEPFDAILRTQNACAPVIG